MSQVPTPKSKALKLNITFIIAPLDGSATALEMWLEPKGFLTEKEQLVRTQIKYQLFIQP